MFNRMEKIARVWRCAECGFTGRGMAHSYQHAVFHWEAEQLIARLTKSEMNEIFPILIEDIDPDDE